MSATFESYVDHVQKFPDRVKHFATGGGVIHQDGEGIDEYFDDATDDHQNRYSRASMLLSPGMVAKAVLQWLRNPKLKGGELLPEHLQIAAYLGQHTVRPVTRNEYMNNQEGLDGYWKEWTNLEAKGVYNYRTRTEWGKVI